MDFRIRPKSNYLAKADWHELYQLAEYWQRDIRFCEDELNFLYKLADRDFSFIVDDAEISSMETVIKKIVYAAKRCEEIARRVRVHLAYLAGLMENPFSHDAYAFREEHNHLEDELDNFMLLVRETKHDVFALTERVMQPEKFRFL